MFRAVCPGKSAHTLVEVVKDPQGQVLICTWRYLHTIQGEPFRNDTELSTGHLVSVEGRRRLGTETTELVVPPNQSPRTWWVRCCCVAGIETEWILAQVESKTRRAVVPASMLLGHTL